MLPYTRWQNTGYVLRAVKCQSLAPASADQDNERIIKGTKILTEHIDGYSTLGRAANYHVSVIDAHV
jgi:hypothetical protein